MCEGCECEGRKVVGGLFHTCCVIFLLSYLSTELSCHVQDEGFILNCVCVCVCFFFVVLLCV